MEPHCGVHLLFGILCCLWVRGLSGILSDDRKQIGSIMCETVCRQVNECMNHAFFMSALSFVIGRNHRVSGKEGEAWLNETEVNLSCAKFYNGRHSGNRCLNAARQRQKEESKRLLVAKYSSVSRRFRLLYLPERRMEEYPIIKARFVTAIGYISKLKKVLVSTERPGRTDAYILGRPGKPSRMCKIAARSVAVDEDSELVFLASVRGGLQRITTAGSDFSLVRKRGQYYDIAVNSRLKYVYACFAGKFLLTFTYQGKLNKHIARGNGILAVTFDTNGGAIFYTHERRLIKYANSTRSRVVSFTWNPLKLVHFGKGLYVTFEEKDDIAAVDVSSGRVSERYHEYKKQSTGLLISFVN